MLSLVKNINWISVTENFIADASVTLILGFFLVWLLDWNKRPRLKLIINLQDPPKESFHWASVIIANDGRSALREKEVFWHIYWPHSLAAEFIQKEKYPFENIGESEIDGERTSHLMSFNRGPLFPEREIEILRFKSQFPFDPKQLRVRYQFSSAIGLIPRWIWSSWRFTKIQDKSGFPKLNLLPIAYVRDIRTTEYRNKSFIPPENLSGKKF